MLNHILQIHVFICVNGMNVRNDREILPHDGDWLEQKATLSARLLLVYSLAIESFACCVKRLSRVISTVSQVRRTGPPPVIGWYRRKLHFSKWQSFRSKNQKPRLEETDQKLPRGIYTNVPL
jgi:hypothetical protein